MIAAVLSLGIFGILVAVVAILVIVWLVRHI